MGCVEVWVWVWVSVASSAEFNLQQQQAVVLLISSRHVSGGAEGWNEMETIVVFYYRIMLLSIY